MNNYLFWKRFAQGKLKTHVSSVKIRIPSPKEILSWSERRLPNSTLVGKIDNAHTVEHDTLRPVSGGLFCERIFGPIATNVCACLRRKGWNEDYCKICEVQFTKSRLRRYQMGHILLAAPVIHIWALQGGYLANLLGKKNLGIRSIAYGKVMCQSKLFCSANNVFNKVASPKEVPSIYHYETRSEASRTKRRSLWTTFGQCSSESIFDRRASTSARTPTTYVRSSNEVASLLRQRRSLPCLATLRLCLPRRLPSVGAYFNQLVVASLTTTTTWRQSLPRQRRREARLCSIEALTNLRFRRASLVRGRQSQPSVDRRLVVVASQRPTYGQLVVPLQERRSNCKNQIQKVYKRENVLPFYQFVLYKPDTFNKITQFFNSLDGGGVTNFQWRKAPIRKNQTVPTIFARQNIKATSFATTSPRTPTWRLCLPRRVARPKISSSNRGKLKTSFIQSSNVVASGRDKLQLGEARRVSTMSFSRPSVASLTTTTFGHEARLCSIEARRQNVEALTNLPFVRGRQSLSEARIEDRASTYRRRQNVVVVAVVLPLPHYSRQKLMVLQNKTIKHTSFLGTFIKAKLPSNRHVGCVKPRTAGLAWQSNQKPSYYKVPSSYDYETTSGALTTWRQSLPRRQNVEARLNRRFVRGVASRSSSQPSESIFYRPGRQSLSEARRGRQSQRSVDRRRFDESYGFNVVVSVRNFGVFSRSDTLYWGVFCDKYDFKLLPNAVVNKQAYFKNKQSTLQKIQNLVWLKHQRSEIKSKEITTLKTIKNFQMPVIRIEESKLTPNSSYSSLRSVLYSITTNLTLSPTSFAPSRSSYYVPRLATLNVEVAPLLRQIFHKPKVGLPSMRSTWRQSLPRQISSNVEVASLLRQTKGRAKLVGGEADGTSPYLRSNRRQSFADSRSLVQTARLASIEDDGTFPVSVAQLIDIKNIAYTGSSVLFQSLKNLNLVLLYSLISWKWKKLKEELNKFLLQNKLTKKKRNLRNKIAKAKIILTKRKNLIQSFLSTSQLPEWMIISILPVLPPTLRPILELEPNNVVVSDLNVLYQTVIRRNDALMGLLSFRALEIDILNRQVSLQQAIEKLFDKGAGTKKRPVKSLSQGFHGKKGLFRSHLLGKRVDYSGRSVIVVGPQLKLHECGLPKEMALVLFLPFLIARLKKRKIVTNTSQAKQLILHKDKQVWSHLKSLIYEHPVLLNRAPTLHRLGFQAFQPILVSGKAMILPALVCTGFNADFDGDQMAVHIPLSHAARAESWKLLHAKNNMLSPATGKPIVVLSQEMILGCYCSSLILSKTHFNESSGSSKSYGFKGFKGFKEQKKTTLVKLRPPYDRFLSSPLEDRLLRPTFYVPSRSLFQPASSSESIFDRPKHSLLKLRKNLYFTTFQDIYKALGSNKITIQTAVWLRIPFFEDNQFLEEPLEIRLDALGHFFRSYCQSQRHFSKSIKSKDQLKGISYIRTSAGRIQLNETFYSSWS